MIPSKAKEIAAVIYTNIIEYGRQAMPPDWKEYSETTEGKALIGSVLSGEDWISVKDRLPEPGDIGSKKYLLLCHGQFAVSSYLKGFNSKYDEENKKDGFRNYDGSTGGYNRFNPTHWMEIPEPPKP